MNTFKALQEASTRLALPLYYKTDLAHDRRALEDADPPHVFGWVLYDCGTHFIDPRAMGVGAAVLQTWREVFRSMFTGDRHCFVWAGDRLIEVATADVMIDWLESSEKQ